MKSKDPRDVRGSFLFDDNGFAMTFFGVSYDGRHRYAFSELPEKLLPVFFGYRYQKSS